MEIVETINFSVDFNLRRNMATLTSAIRKTVGRHSSNKVSTKREKN